MELFKLLGTVAIDNSAALKELDNTTSKAQKSESKLIKTFKNIGTAVAAAFAVEKIASFGKACIDASANAKAMESQFSQVFGDLESEASDDLASIADDVGVMESRMKGSYTKIAAFAKTTGMDTADSLNLANRAMVAIADSAAFYDRTLEDTTESLQSFLKGNYENDAALGLSCTEITRNEAANRLYGQSFKDLSEQQKQLTLLQMVEDANKLSGAIGQASRESDTWTNQTGNLNQAWIDFKATVGDLVLEPATKAVGGLANFVKKLSDAIQSAREWIGKNQDTIDKWKGVIVAVSAAVGSFLIVMNWGSVMTTAAAGINLVKTAMIGLGKTIAANPIGLLVSAISGLIAYFGYLYNTSEEFRQKVDEVWAGIKKGIDRIMPIIKKAVDTVSSIIKKVINFVKPIIESAFSFISSLFETSAENAGGFINAIKDFFISAWESIKGVWETIVPFFDMVWENVIAPVGEMLGEMIGAFQEAWNVICLVWEAVAPFFETIWEQIKVVFSAVAGVLGGFFEAAWGIIQVVWSVAVAFFKTIWEGIKAVFSVVVEVLGSTFSLAWEAIKAVWNTAIDFFTAIWAGIKAVFATVGAVLSGNFDDAWVAIKNSWNQTLDFFSSLWEGIKGIFGGVADWFGSVFSAAWEAVLAVFKVGGTIFEGISEAISDVFVTIVNGLIKGINAVIAVPFNTINGVLNKIRDIDILGLEPFSGLWGRNPLAVPQIPELEEGAVLEKGQVGLLEGNGAEAVVPLDKNEKWIAAVADDMEEAIGTGNTGAILNKMNELIETIKALKIYLDTDILVGELTPAIDTELGQIYAGKERGR